MTITSNSPIQDSGNLYVNSLDFDPQIFFTDSHSSLNFLIMRWDEFTGGGTGVWKVIYNGTLSGYLTDTYNYRVSLDNYIKIEAPKDLSGFNIWNDDEKVLYKRLYGNICNVSIVISASNILTTYSSSFTTRANGEVIGNAAPSTIFNGISTVTVKDFECYDKVDGEFDLIPTTNVIYRNTWIPLSCFQPHAYIERYINVRDINNQNIAGMSGWGTDEGTLRQFLLYVPSNAHYVAFFDSLDGTETRIYCKTKCDINPIYYWGINGQLDVLYCEGNQSEINNVTKEYIKIGDKQLPINIQTQKQLKYNTGYMLDQSQLYSLIKTPYVFNSQYGDLERVSRNFLLDSTFNISSNSYGIDATNSYISEQHYVQGQTYTITIYGTLGADRTAFGIYNHASTINFGDLTYRSTGVYALTFTADANQATTNELRVLQYPSNGTSYSTIKNITVTKGSTIQPWEQAMEETGQSMPTLKRYMLNTNSFDGYIGKNLSERNVELILEDEKKYKRRTNIELDFFE